MKAEGFRASEVYPRLVHDLLLDLRRLRRRAGRRARRPTATPKEIHGSTAAASALLRRQEYT